MSALVHYKKREYLRFWTPFAYIRLHLNSNCGPGFEFVILSYQLERWTSKNINRQRLPIPLFYIDQYHLSVDRTDVIVRDILRSRRKRKNIRAFLEQSLFRCREISLWNRHFEWFDVLMPMGSYIVVLDPARMLFGTELAVYIWLVRWDTDWMTKRMRPNFRPLHFVIYLISERPTTL